VMADGHRQICDFSLAGDLLGFANGDDYAFSAEAIEDCHPRPLPAQRPGIAH